MSCGERDRPPHHAAAGGKFARPVPDANPADVAPRGAAAQRLPRAREKRVQTTIEPHPDSGSWNCGGASALLR